MMKWHLTGMNDDEREAVSGGTFEKSKERRGVL
jgi:hypothetical protein